MSSLSVEGGGLPKWEGGDIEVSRTQSDVVTRQSVFEASTKYFLQPIESYLQDDSVTEIMINGHADVYVERDGRLEKATARFDSEDALVSAVNNIAQWVGRRIDEDHPVLDARLPDGSRVHAIIPPQARTGTYLTIRKFTRRVMTLDDFVRLGSLSPVGQEFLKICVRLGKNVIISGGTGTGKTSLLAALTRAIPEGERIVVIEDTSELRLNQKHCLYLEAQHDDSAKGGRLDVRQLFINSLRMRPDRIIVGEVRSGEALDLIQSMLSGHAGSLSTVHASSPRDALIRLETLSLMSDVELPVYVARAQVAAAINLVVAISRFSEDGSRRVTGISEVIGLDDGNQYVTRDLFALKYSGRDSDGTLITELQPTGNRPSFWSEPLERGLGPMIDRTGMLWESQEERKTVPSAEEAAR